MVQCVLAGVTTRKATLSDVRSHPLVLQLSGEEDLARGKDYEGECPLVTVLVNLLQV